MLRLVLATALGRAAGRLSRLLGRGGSALPGLIAEKVDPRTSGRRGCPVRRGVVGVNGTNGKTTTTKMLVGMLEGEGWQVVTNGTGSPPAPGSARGAPPRIRACEGCGRSAEGCPSEGR